MDNYHLHNYVDAITSGSFICVLVNEPDAELDTYVDFSYTGGTDIELTVLNTSDYHVLHERETHLFMNSDDSHDIKGITEYVMRWLGENLPEIRVVSGDVKNVQTCELTIRTRDAH